MYMDNRHFSQVNQHLLSPFNLSLEVLQSQIDLFREKQIDFGDLYLQKTMSEGWSLEDNIVKHGSFNIDQGIGARAVFNGDTGFAYADDFSLPSIQKLITTALYLLKNSKQKRAVKAFRSPNYKALYPNASPLESLSSKDKIDLLQQINCYANKLDQRIEKVSASLSGALEVILLLTTEGLCAMDVRPLVRINVSILMAENNSREQFSSKTWG